MKSVGVGRCIHNNFPIIFFIISAEKFSHCKMMNIFISVSSSSFKDNI